MVDVVDAAERHQPVVEIQEEAGALFRVDHNEIRYLYAAFPALFYFALLPIEELSREDRNAFHNGLRLTVYVLALGGVQGGRHDWLKPWTEAMDASPSAWHRERYGMPLD